MVAATLATLSMPDSCHLIIPYSCIYTSVERTQNYTLFSTGYCKLFNRVLSCACLLSFLITEVEEQGKNEGVRCKYLLHYLVYWVIDGVDITGLIEQLIGLPRTMHGDVYYLLYSQ